MFERKQKQGYGWSRLLQHPVWPRPASIFENGKSRPNEQRFFSSFLFMTQVGQRERERERYHCCVYVYERVFFLLIRIAQPLLCVWGGSWFFEGVAGFYLFNLFPISFRLSEREGAATCQEPTATYYYVCTRVGRIEYIIFPSHKFNQRFFFNWITAWELFSLVPPYASITQTARGPNSKFVVYLILPSSGLIKEEVLNENLRWIASTDWIKRTCRENRVKFASVLLVQFFDLSY